MKMQIVESKVNLAFSFWLWNWCSTIYVFIGSFVIRFWRIFMSTLCQVWHLFVCFFSEREKGIFFLVCISFLGFFFLVVQRTLDTICYLTKRARSLVHHRLDFSPTYYDSIYKCMKHGKDTETGKKQQQQLQFGEAKILNKQNKHI